MGDDVCYGSVLNNRYSMIFPSRSSSQRQSDDVDTMSECVNTVERIFLVRFFFLSSDFMCIFFEYKISMHYTGLDDHGTRYSFLVLFCSQGLAR